MINTPHIVPVIAWVLALGLFFILMNNLKDRRSITSNSPIAFVIGLVIWLIVVNILADALFKDLYGSSYVKLYSVMGISKTTLYSISGVIALFTTAPLVLYFNSRNPYGGSIFGNPGRITPEQKTKLVIAIIGLITAIINFATEILPHYLE